MHTCGLRASGAARCWGDAEVSASTPGLALDGLSVPLGSSRHACGVRRLRLEEGHRWQGTVLCWGAASAGVPRVVKGTFVQVVTGQSESCGLRPAGYVVCWDNATGANAADADFVPPVSRLDDVSGGWDHFCGLLRTNSEVVCWGDNTHGQAGVTSGTLLSRIDAGGQLSCGITLTLGIECWGAASAVRGTPAGSGFRDIDAGQAHACAIRSPLTGAEFALHGGEAVCWGLDADGRLDAPAGVGLVSVSAGVRHSCGVTPLGEVVCWGDNSHGQAPQAKLSDLSLTLADGSGTDLLDAVFDSGEFEYVVAPPASAATVMWSLEDNKTADPQVSAVSLDGNTVANGDVVSLEAGDEISVAVASLFGFGPSRTYTIRVENPPRLTSLSVRAETGEPDCPGTGCPPYSLVPMFDPVVTEYSAVVPPGVGEITVEYSAPGASDAVTASPADAVPPLSGVMDPKPGHQMALTTNTGFVSMEVGNDHSCGVLTGNVARCWGSDLFGRTTVPAGAYSAVSAGWGHSCGLTTSGNARCWGDRFFGQSRTPQGSFSAVSAGWGHSCGLTTSGNARCWGYNFSGQSRAPTGTFSAVSAGGNHSCGIMTTGAMRCWGLNRNGQSRAPAGTFTALSAGWRHNCAIRSDSTVACWGNSGSGRTTAPTGTFTAVSAGEEHSCGVKSDGTAVCWGANGSGQAKAPTGTFTAVSAGEDHSCGLAVGGSVVCWGAAGAALQPAMAAALTLTVTSTAQLPRISTYTVRIHRAAAVPSRASATSAAPPSREQIAPTADHAARNSETARACPVSDGTVVDIADAALRGAVETALGKAAGASVTGAELAALAELKLPLAPGDATTAVVDLTGLEAAAGLVTLDVSGHDIDDLSAVGCLRALETLVLSGNQISDVSDLSGLDSLRVLWLDRNLIDDISAFSGLTSLERLYLYDNLIDDVSALDSMTALTELYLDHNEVSDISALSGLTELEALGLSHNNVDDASALSGLTALAQAYLNDNDLMAFDALAPLIDADLRIVWLSGNRITLLPSIGSARLSSYEYLDIRYNEIVDVDDPFGARGTVHSLPQRDTPVKVPDEVLASALRLELSMPAGDQIVIGRLAKLRKLSHRGSDTGGRITSLIGLEGASQLRELNLWDNSVTDISPVSGLTSLRQLDLGRNGFTDLIQFDGMNSLRDLRLLDNGITNLTTLPALTELRALALSFNDLGNIARLTALTGLEDLSLVGTSITDITPLAGLTELRLLQISGNTLASIDTLAKLTELRRLRMSSIGISDLAPITGLHELITLTAADNEISSLEPLRGLRELKNLQVSRNRITGIEPITPLAHLEWLHIDDNQVTSLEPLRAKTALWLLNIDGNQVTDITPLSTLTALQTLSLARNRITDFAPINGLSGLATTGQDEQLHGTSD